MQHTRPCAPSRPWPSYPVYFGVLFIINNAIGLITPLVGVVLNVVCGVSPGVDGRSDPAASGR